MIALVLACAAGLVAAILMRDHLADPGALWRDVQHDRNTHLALAMNLAQHMRDANAAGFLQHLAGMTVWPPLHALLLALVLVLGNAGHAAAILPSLAGWAATVVLCGLLAGRLAGQQGRAGAWFAAGVAGAFAIASPALRLLGSDVMLEALGAALSAATLLAWMRCAEAPGRAGRWRLLSVLLTLLFLEKYNYWALMAAALALAAAPARWRHWADTARAARRTIRPRLVWRDPLLLLGTGLLAATAWIALHGPVAIQVWGRSFSLYPPGHIMSLAYGLLLLRGAIWWRAQPSCLAPAIGPAGLAVLRWHALPVALWLLVPYVLQNLIWFLGGNYVTVAGYDPWRNLLFLAEGFGSGFHVAPWAAALSTGLALAGLWRTVRPDGAKGGWAVAVFLLLSAVAVVLHPQQQWRFQASWLFALWALAGAGAALLLRAVPPRLHVWAGSAGLAVLAAALSVQPVSPVAALAAIRRADGPSDLVLAQAYAAFVAGGEPAGFVSPFGRNDFFEWTMRAQCRCPAPAGQPFTFTDRSRAAVAATTASWLATTPSRRIVAVDAAPRTENPAAGLVADWQRGQLDALLAQDRFRLAATIAVPAGAAAVSLWTDTQAPPQPPRRRLLIEWAMLALAAAILVVLLA